MASCEQDDPESALTDITPSSSISAPAVAAPDQNSRRVPAWSKKNYEENRAALTAIALETSPGLALLIYQHRCEPSDRLQSATRLLVQDFSVQRGRTNFDSIRGILRSRIPRSGVPSGNIPSAPTAARNKGISSYDFQMTAGRSLKEIPDGSGRRPLRALCFNLGREVARQVGGLLEPCWLQL